MTSPGAPGTRVSYQSGSGSDGGAMAALTPAAVNMAKFGVLTRLGQTGDWPGIGIAIGPQAGAML